MPTRANPDSEPLSEQSTPSLTQKSSRSTYSPVGRDYKPKSARGSINVMTPEVVDAFDKCKISYRNSVHIIAAVATALGIN